MAANQRNIEDIFTQAFESHEMAVSPHVWTGIQSTLAASVAASGTATAAGGTFLAKAAAVVGMTALITAATISEVRYHKQEQVVAEAVEITVPVQTPVEATASSEIEPQAPKTTQENTEAPAKVSSPVVAMEQPAARFTGKERDVKPKASSPKTGEVVMAEEHPERESSQTADAEEQKPSRNDVLPKSTKADLGQSSEQNAKEEEESTASGTTITEEKPAVEEPAQQETIARFSHQAKTWISADGDGTQDFFSVEGTDVQEFHIRIWEKGGQLVFESDNPDFKWYGTDLSGKTLPNRTVCYYEINAVGTDGLLYKGRNARGSITIFH